ncbi:MAG: cardiolipin synthase [Gammaproteobacteria bacterium]|nr:MAG: cardiolipin synthase [Gammaproteobacteria bacterium]PIE39662.1 MAG: cardiolipin synthase [Gammaproteobacteria bacterium]
MYVLAILSVLRALRSTRTSQGAIAWILSLLTIPYIAIPLYWIFGRNKFAGYYQQRETLEKENRHLVDQSSNALAEFIALPDDDQLLYKSLGKLARMPATTGNRVELLINGEATYDSMAQGLEAAQSYILFQFYIIRDDAASRRLGDILVRKSLAGVKVFVLYDEIGTRQFHRSELHRKLLQAGVNIAAFNTTQGPKNRLQINFRNHRKTVVVDGRKAWTGGLNLGEEYLGKHHRLSPWRDTHTCVSGPAVLALQLAFATDWRWAMRSPMGLNWNLQPHWCGDHKVLVIASDPSGLYDEAGLMFHQAIVEARQRIWITSPYFVPDQATVSALQLAALRGVDVRVMIPDNPDGVLVDLAAWSYTRKLNHTGVKIYRYEPGFLHQKVLLMDDHLAGVGTANFDNRSFRLNFEITLLVDNREFAADIAKMLERDFANSRLVSTEDFAAKPWWHHYASDAASLLSPLL